jgi:tetratricopeptide (TPR) repeat protein
MEVYRLGLIAMEVLLEQAPDNPAYLLCQGQLQLRIAKEQRRVSASGTIESVFAARDSLERALALDPRNGVAACELADAYRMIGIHSRDRGDNADIEELFAKAVRLLETQFAERPGDKLLQRQLAGTTRLLAYAQLVHDKKQQALESLGRCRELWRPARIADSLTPEDEKAYAEACYDEGMLAQELDRPDVARAAFAEGVEAFKLRGNAHDEVAANRKRPPRNLRPHAECHFYLGRHQAAAGETEAAVASFRRSVELLEPFAQLPNVTPALKDTYAKASSELDKLQEKVGSDGGASPTSSPP